MRILLATQHIHLPQGTGGLEINTHVLCQALIRQGHDAQVYCGLHDTTLQWSRRAITKLMGQTLLRDTVMGYPVYRARYPMMSALEAASTIQPDIVVTQGWNAAELASAFSAMGIRAVLYAHNAQRLDDAERSLEIIANSRFTALLHPGRRVIGIVPPLIEPEGYRVATSRERVLFVNPIAQKGIAIAAALARARPDIDFDFYEAWLLTPQERTHARLLTQDLANVHWHGAVSDMRRAYCRAKLVLFPSAMETWGRVASEAHISGIPTLGSDRGALPETVGPGGLCVPYEAPPEEWQRALSHLWDNEQRYAGYAVAAANWSRRSEIAPRQVLEDFVNLLETRLDADAPLRSSQYG